MKSIDSRLNELEQRLGNYNRVAVPIFQYMTDDIDTEQKQEQDMLDQFEKYKAENKEKYPLLANMSYKDFVAYLKRVKAPACYITHICFVHGNKKGVEK